MKPVLVVVLNIVLGLMSHYAMAEPACEAAIRANVEVGGEFSLADLLAANACPALRQAAAGLRLGAAPLPGSVRVLSADQVRSLLLTLRSPGSESFAAASVRVPERVVIRRAGSRASCLHIVSSLIPALRPSPAFAQSGMGAKPGLSRMPSGPVDCGAGGRIAENAPLVTTHAIWDPALDSWEISARCVHASDCVPFLVRVPGVEGSSETAGSVAPAMRLIAGITESPARSEPSALRSAGESMLVRAGAKVTLVWEHGGIRAVAPAISLDGGAPGERVRARITSSGRIVPAVVVGAGVVRASV
jgi:hypothetical protein